VKIKPLGAIAEKWARNAAAASDDYRTGLPGSDWEGPASAAATAYQQGVTAAIGRGAFASGVRQAGNTKWLQAAQTKGVERYPGGVAGAQGVYQEGFASSHQVLSGLSLPPRGPRGAEGNLERVRAVTRALHQAKVGRG